MFNKIIAATTEVINTYKEKDPAATNSLLILMTYPGVHAIMYYRIANLCWRHDVKFLGSIISQFARWATGIEIHPGATIGKRLFIDHGNGVVIGETAIIGNDVVMFHQVTLGGTGKDKGKRHPTVEDNVMLCAGCKVLGNILIGKNSKVGANAVVLGDVPRNATVIGCPAKIVKLDGQRVEIPIKSKTHK